MIENTNAMNLADIARARHVPGIKHNHAPATSPDTLKTLRTALRDYKAAQCRDVDAAFVERVNARADAAYKLPVATLAEADAMLRLVIASDGDALDLPVLDALKSVSAFLKSGAS